LSPHIDLISPCLNRSLRQILTESDIEGFTEELLIENHNAATTAVEGLTSDAPDPADVSFEGGNVDNGLERSKSNSSNLPRIQQSQSGPKEATATPIFRVFSMDSIPSTDTDDEEDDNDDNDNGDRYDDHISYPFLYSRSLDLLYETIRNAVRMNQSTTFAERSLSDFFVPRAVCNQQSYGLNSLQFFGLALPVVRQAVEMIPESCAAVIAPPPAPQYKPCYVLPSRVRLS
jgi:hypothetical protein